MPVPQKLQIGRQYGGLPVDTWNWIIDTIERIEAQQQPLPLAPPSGGGSGGEQALGLLVENNAGADLKVFHVVSLGDARLDVAGDESTRLSSIVLKAEKADPDRQIGIVQEPITDGQLGRAAIAGLSVVKLDVQDESDTTAQAVKDDQAKLKTGGGPIPIVWKEDGTGEKWAIVLLGGGGGIKIYHFEMSQDMAIGDTAKTAIVLDDSGAPVSPTVTINVIDTEQHITAKAAYTGADGTSQDAFAGYALKFTDDYNATGNPGAHILSIEGFAPIIAVRLLADVSSTGSVPVELIDPPSLPDIGSNYCGRVPEDPLLVFNSTSVIALGATADEKWIAGYQPDSGKYEFLCPIRRKLIKFVLITQLSPSVNQADAIDQETGQNIVVLDLCRVMTAYGPYGGFNATSQPGYCGLAEHFTDDYQGTGKPGANIVSIEGPQPIIACVLQGNVTSSGPTGANLVLNIPSTTYGSNYCGRVPAPASAGNFIVWNTAGLAQNAQAGEQWVCFYQNDTQRYELIVPLEKGGGQTIVVKINGTIGAADLSAGVAPGIGSGFRLTWNGTAWVDAGEGTLELQNHSETTIEGPITLRAHKIEGQWVLDMYDFNAMRNSDQSEYQIAWAKAGDKDYQLESIEDFDTSVAQPIHHPSGGDDLRFKDAAECPS